MQRVHFLPEHPIPGKRLGRHVNFDERSRAYRVARTSDTVVTKRWHRAVAPFDQGDLGSCTGNGAVGVLATAPFALKGTSYDEAFAVRVYEQATHEDRIKGIYPPDDTGSTILAAMKALKKLELVDEYHWCFGLEDVLLTLSHVGPIEVGISWYEGFDNPDSHGRVRIEGEVRGGHAFEVLEVDVEEKTVTAMNSWGRDWGEDGWFSFSWDDLDRLLHEDGEAATIAKLHATG